MVARNSDATWDVREEKKGKVQRADTPSGQRRAMDIEGPTVVGHSPCS